MTSKEALKELSGMVSREKCINSSWNKRVNELVSIIENDLKKLYVAPELSEQEIVFLKQLDEKYKYIARDLDGTLHVFTKKPYRYYRSWMLSEKLKAEDNNLFTFIKWDDKEPYFINKGGNL